MQTPLFWLDLSQYNGAKVKAIASNGKMKGLLVDMSAGIDDELAHTLRMLGFERSEPDTPHLLYSGDNRPESREQIRHRLTKAQEVPFSVADHLAIVEQASEQTVERPPVKNDIQQQRDELDQAMGRRPVEVPPGRTRTEKIADTGVVTGFAIKDLRGSGDAVLRTIAGMTDEQVDVHLTKNALWPSLDYKAMAEQGVEPGAVYLMKNVRDSLRGSPNEQPRRRRMRKARAHPEVYAHCVVTLRDALKDVKTLDQAVDAIHAVSEVFAHTRNEATSRGTVTTTSFRSPIEQDANGEPIEHRDLITVTSSRYDFHAIWKIPYSDDEHTRQGQKDRLHSDAGFRSRNNTAWCFLPRNHPLRTGRENTLTEEDKEQRREAEKDKAPTRVKRTHHENAVREGMPHRRDGNVIAEDLIERFDLSGVEFGNWESQADRQELLNQAYDAYSDLADALGLPPEVIGLGGKLGMAFGSRGRGGKSAAAAHFEPTNNAINMTKYAGAGSLAHEWGHALDRSMTRRGVVGRRAVMATDDLNGMAAQVRPRTLENVRAGDTTANNLNAVMRAIMTDPNETRKLTEKQVLMELKIGMSPWCDSIEIKHMMYQWSQSAQELSEFMMQTVGESVEKDLSEDYFIRPDDAASIVSDLKSMSLTRVDDGEAAAGEIMEGLTRYKPLWDDTVRETVANRLEETIEALSGIQSVCGAIASVEGTLGEFIAEGATEAWRDQCKDLADRSLSRLQGRVRPAASKMYLEAKRMDGDRSKSYWSLSEEMFARSFEAYVKYKVCKQSGRNDYLVSYSKPATANGKTFDSVYPTGEHLAGVATAMDQMFAEISQEHVESASPIRQGKKGVLMYSIDGDTITAGVPEPVKLEMLISDIRRMIGRVADIDMEPTLGERDGHQIAGAYNTERRLIQLAMDSQDPRAASHHEAFHAASEHLLDDTEHAIVSAAFDVGGRYRKDLERALLQDNKHHVIAAVQNDPEEAMAYGFQYWMAGRLDARPETPVGQLFKRVKDFYESVCNAVRGYSFLNTDDIFSRLESGGLRERHEKLHRLGRPQHEAIDALRRPESQHVTPAAEQAPKASTSELSM